MIFKTTVMAYVPEKRGFIDEGWGDLVMFFRNKPTKEDIHGWLRCTEVTKAKNFCTENFDETGKTILYIQDN